MCCPENDRSFIRHATWGSGVRQPLCHRIAAAVPFRAQNGTVVWHQKPALVRTALRRSFVREPTFTQRRDVVDAFLGARSAAITDRFPDTWHMSRKRRAARPTSLPEVAATLPKYLLVQAVFRSSRWFCQGSRPRLWPTRAGLAMSRLLQRGVDEDAVLGMWVAGRDRAAGAHRPGLPSVPLPYVRQAVQRALRHPAEPGPVSVRCHRTRG